MEPLETADKSLQIADKSVKLLDRFPLAVLCLLELGFIIYLLLWVKAEIAENSANQARSLKDKQLIIETQAKVLETQEKRAQEQVELNKAQAREIEWLKDQGSRR